jgi:hypothetical protein
VNNIFSDNAVERSRNVEFILLGIVDRYMKFTLGFSKLSYRASMLVDYWQSTA